MQSVLIVDDHVYARELLREIVHKIFEQASIEEAATLSQASALIAQKNFNLALIDISLPDGSGIDLVKEIISLNAQTYIVMATIYDDDQHLFDSLRAGANGYLLKDLSRDELEKQIRGIIIGNPPLSSSIARRLLAHFNQPTQAQKHNLTRRETEALTLIAKGLTRKEVASNLNISANTAAEHIQNIYQKLNINSRAEAALEACRLGLVIP
ncbi:MAG: response regulator transcription factor [Methylococcales bacterium]|nr:response regulator transcription factor [Methylococcales bacterium]